METTSTTKALGSISTQPDSYPRCKILAIILAMGRAVILLKMVHLLMTLQTATLMPRILKSPLGKA